MHATAENFDNVHGELLTKIYAGDAVIPTFGDISLDITTKMVRGPEGAIRLTDKEYCVLWLLVRARGGYVGVDEIIYFLYDDSDADIPLANNTQVFVSRARKKIIQTKANVQIDILRGYGYLLRQG
jgi:DNA-binding response OmpR family regulator